MTTKVFTLGIIALSSMLASQLSQAEEALARNDFDLASRIASGEIKSNPASAGAHVLLARALIGNNDAVRALDELELALKLQPRNLDALYYTNKLTAVLARQELTRLYQIAPDSGRVHQVLAESLHAQGDSAGEEREYLAALERMPDSAVVLAALGDLARFQGSYEDAYGYYSRAEKVDSRNFDALYGIGACSIFLKEYKKAVRSLDRALKVDPQSSAARLALGDALIRDEQYGRAVDVLARLVETEPFAKQGWALYGKALRQAGLKPDADAAFARYRELQRAGVSDLP